MKRGKMVAEVGTEDQREAERKRKDQVCLIVRQAEDEISSNLLRRRLSLAIGPAFLYSLSSLA